MGVTGLWRLIEPAGKPVPVETLENKILAVDISIWLHQMVKGYQDAKGAPLPNAHLIGLFQRLCKLLYFRIKPVFVFDGGFPDLKRETIAKRQDNKTKYNSASEKLKREIALLLGKKTAIGALLGKQISPTKNKQPENNDDIFKLPELPEKVASESDSESDDEHDSSASTVDLHAVDFDSAKFKNMPIKEKYDLLIELKETRKMNSWGKINTLPKKSDNFSDFQMQRLLKRRKLQECLEETEKEMGDEGMSLNELESLLNEEGIDTKIDSLPSRRIASNNTTRYLLISNVRQALENAKKKEESAQQSEIVISEGAKEEKPDCKESQNNDELEDDLQKAIKMSLECAGEADTSACTSKTDESWTSFVSDSDYSEDEDDGFEAPDMSSAKSYIKQYTDLTYKIIDNIVAPKQKDKIKSDKPKINEIIEELEQEKTIIEDHVELLSSDEDNKGDSKVLEKSNTDHDRRESNDKSMPEKGTVIDSLSDELDEMNYADASVMCVEKSIDDVINLDSSLEEQSEKKQEIMIETVRDLSSSDDDFEDVSDKETESKKQVIELTLNMGKEVEDDIFADVFTKKADDRHLESDKSNINIGIKGEKRKQKEIPSDVKNKQNVAEEPIKTDVSKHEVAIASTSKTCDDAKETNRKEIVDLSVCEEAASQQAKQKNPVTPERQKISTDELNTMVTDIENEEQVLLNEKGKLDRIGRNITEQMTKEAQELLQIFGIPYIVAPMEAEAQCAVLETLNVTDGTITDDSDIWLFGGNTVYKNFFNQKKHVLQYLRERLEKSFNLNREKLVLLALLVGSDYTVGVNGVGPVTALEILASFPFNKKKVITENAKFTDYQEIVAGLQDFKKWVRGGKRTDNVSLKKKLRNVSLSDDFPSVRVVQAYFEPNVVKSNEKFSWGNPDITELREYARAKFGWSQHKLDEIIKPVIKRMQERKCQKTVHDYFKKKTMLDSLEDQVSKRVKAAIQKMGSEAPIEEQTIEDVKQKPKRTKKNSTNKDSSKAGPSKAKRKKLPDETEQISGVIKTAPVVEDDPVVGFDISVPKTDRYQEIIPQREKDKKSILENKLKAIEVFRKSKIDPKKKLTKRRLPVPKENADLSESSDTD